MARHLRIAGTVQGVGYRAGFAARAQALKLSGWVRNRRDGSVEAIIAGPAEALDAMLEWARRGPAFAQVQDIAVTEADEPDLRAGHFDILPTA
jgi:acylphosphatase